MFERDIARGNGRRTRNVDRPKALRRRAREIQRQFATCERHIQRDFQRLVNDAIVVEEILRAISTLRQLAHQRPHQPRGAHPQLGERGKHHARRVFREERVHAAHPEVQRGKLRVQVAPEAARQARIGPQDRQDILLDFT